MKKRPVGKQKTLTIKLDDDLEKDFTVYEIRPYDLFQIMDQQDSVLQFAEKMLALCSTVTTEDLKILYLTDIEKLVEAFEEINSPLARLAKKFGLNTFIDTLRFEIKKIFGELSASLFKPATPTPSTTE